MTWYASQPRAIGMSGNCSGNTMFPCRANERYAFTVAAGILPAVEPGILPGGNGVWSGMTLSTPFHKYDHVCGEGFLAQTRRERRAYPSEGSVRSEQRRLGRKEPPPGGLRRFSVLALLLLGHSPTSGDAPSSRLARTENRRNKRGRIYETEYLGFGALGREARCRPLRQPRWPPLRSCSPR